MEDYHISKGQAAEEAQKEASLLKEMAQCIEDDRFPSKVNLSGASSSLLNSPMSEAEIELSFSSSDGLPGPDGINARLIHRADREAMSKCLLYVFNKLWSEGIFYTEWKKEIRAILAKFGKCNMPFRPSE